MSVRRFFYVRGPRGQVLHRQYGKHHSEGPAACGVFVAPGWSWWKTRDARVPVCKRCEAA